MGTRNGGVRAVLTCGFCGGPGGYGRSVPSVRARESALRRAQKMRQPAQAQNIQRRFAAGARCIPLPNRAGQGCPCSRGGAMRGYAHRPPSGDTAGYGRAWHVPLRSRCKAGWHAPEKADAAA